MSRERVQQVWLPAAGVYAALPEPPKAGSSTEIPTVGSPRRENRSTDAGKLAAPPQKPLHASSPGKRRRSELNDEGWQQRDSQGQQHGSQEAQAAAAPAYTGFQLQCSDEEPSDVEEQEPAPTCPICLVDVVELGDKAVVTPCMHEFCEPCISRWLGHHKRVCPLCKASVGSVLYDITPSGTHKERVVPPSPKLAAVGSGDGDDSGGGTVLLQRLQDFLGVAGLLDPFQQRQQRQQQQRRRRGQQGQQPASSAVRLRTESGSGRSGRPGSTAAAAAAAAAPPPPPGPRPYFWRLQQRLQAGGYRPGGQLGGAAAAAAEERAVTEEDYVLLWRRQVYDQDLWAEPLGCEAARLALGTGSSRERRLTQWIERELRALLQTDDVTILRGFVMGLVAAYGIEPLQHSGSDGGSGSGASYSSQAAARRAAALASSRAAGVVAAATACRDGGADALGGGGALCSSAEEALRPFLYEHSSHFWHELRCFATAPPYTLATYDRMVRYRRREATPPPLPPAAAALPPRSEPPAVLRRNVGVWQHQQRQQQRQGGTGSTGGRMSRWDQGRPGQLLAAVAASANPQQQQQQQDMMEQGRRIEPAHLVARGGGSCGSNLLQLAAVPDASVPRPPRQRHRGGSRNPSPPPMPLPAAERARQQEQQQQQEAAPLPCDRGRKHGQGSRRRELQGSSRSRGRDDGGRERCSYRSRSCSRSLRKRRRRPSRDHSAVRGRERYGGDCAHRSESPEQCSPERYRAGADDGGDRWGM